MVGKKLVATRKTQGQRTNDFCWTTDGEEVFLGGRPTGSHTDDADGSARSFTGVKSHRGTTTAIVAEDRQPDRMRSRIHDALLRSGHGEVLEDADITAEQFSWIVGGEKHLSAFLDRYPTLSSVAVHLAERERLDIDRLPIGTVVEYRDDKILPRAAAR